MAQKVLELRQGGDMPARASLHTPPEVPKLFDKGALEKKGEKKYLHYCGIINVFISPTMLLITLFIL